MEEGKNMYTLNGKLNKNSDMTIYEFITPSDPITFKTDDDKVAFTCALLLGNGKAGCQNTQTDKSLPTMLMFSEDPDKEIKSFIGGDFKKFIEANKPKIKECFNSFAYGSVSERKTYDNALEAITDPKKLKEFKAKYEDENRTSMNQWVKEAWRYAERL